MGNLVRRSPNACPPCAYRCISTGSVLIKQLEEPAQRGYLVGDMLQNHILVPARGFIEMKAVRNPVMEIWWQRMFCLNIVEAQSDPVTVEKVPKR